MKKIALFVAAVFSAPVLAWTNGNIANDVDFAGTITPEQYSQLWRWKVGTNLNNFRHNITDMDQELKKLTITVDSPKGLLYGETVKAIRASAGMGAIPNITLSDFEKKPVTLVQGPSDLEGKGHITLAIKDENNSKIGSLKVDITAVGIATGPKKGETSKTTVTSVGAQNNNHALYGGLFKKGISDGYYKANPMIDKFGAKNMHKLASDVRQHPLLNNVPFKSWAYNTWTVPVNFLEGGENTSFSYGIAAVSYVLGIDKGQKLEATFDTPLTATTRWSAPLNVAVTYN